MTEANENVVEMKSRKRTSKRDGVWDLIKSLRPNWSKGIIGSVRKTSLILFAAPARNKPKYIEWLDSREPEILKACRIGEKLTGPYTPTASTISAGFLQSPLPWWPHLETFLRELSRPAVAPKPKIEGMLQWPDSDWVTNTRRPVFKRTANGDPIETRRQAVLDFLAAFKVWAAENNIELLGE